jgi:transcriptional regulator with XRE-family HTH domain
LPNTNLPNLNAIGEHLRLARVSRRKTTQADLASATGLDRTVINRIERGEKLPSLDQLIRLAKALDLSLHWFLAGKNRPGSEIPELATELRSLGIVDLFVPGEIVPGAFRPREEVLAIAVSGNSPDPRIIEAIPAVLAWNRWDLLLVEPYAHRYDDRAAHRIGWLADVALTLHKHRGFPGGCPAQSQLTALVRSLTKPKRKDDLGRPTTGGQLPPVSLRWNITYAASLETFRKRAEHLWQELEAFANLQTVIEYMEGRRESL